jgi:hypothetical protein
VNRGSSDAGRHETQRDAEKAEKAAVVTLQHNEGQSRAVGEMAEQMEVEF